LGDIRVGVGERTGEVGDIRVEVGERTMVAGDRSQIEGFDRFDGSWNWHWPVPSLFS